MMFEFECDWKRVSLLPVLAFEALECGNPECGEVHGAAFVIGWLFWNFKVGFVA